jgi:phosphoribosylaminoimidazolecarboxamide formyltransferase/IMP cyclohydrolase
MNMDLRYGVNPEQAASASLEAADSPVRVIHGQPSYINVLDALNAWQLVRTASRALAVPAATSFKHVSPAGAATAGAVDEAMHAVWGVSAADVDRSPVTAAYVRARDCDPKSSFGDFVAVSEPVDSLLAKLLASVYSNGIVAPAYEPGTVAVLSAKKGGRFVIMEADPLYEPPAWERRDVFGVRLEQQSPRTAPKMELVAAGAGAESPEPIPTASLRDLVLAMVVARYAQSNSVACARDGMALGVGAGQQSRVDCTKLAGGKVAAWWMRRHPKVRDLVFKRNVRRQERINWRERFVEGDMTAAEWRDFDDVLEARPAPLDEEDRRAWLDRLDNVALASDGYLPFRDNVDQAAGFGVRFIADPGGSAREEEIRAACVEHGITRSVTNVRLFHH